jgi:ubiquinone/menaquinone biosynthesis C-methylase UbiE
VAHDRTVFPALYDRTMVLADRWSLGRMRRESVGAAEGTVIEIAAGTGLNFPHYKADTLVVATEPDSAMLARARRRAADTKAQILMVVADAQNLPFRAGTFDTAVVSLGLCTIPRPAEALDELHRVLAAAGVLHLMEHVRLEQPVAGRLQDFLTPVWRRIAGGCRLNQRTTQNVRGAGFHIVRLHSYARGFFVTMSAARIDALPADTTREDVGP